MHPKGARRSTPSVISDGAASVVTHAAKAKAKARARATSSLQEGDLSLEMTAPRKRQRAADDKHLCDLCGLSVQDIEGGGSFSKRDSVIQNHVWRSYPSAN